MSTNQIDLMKLFRQIKWAENGDVIPFVETNYSIGWAYLGDDTPTVEDFNAVQQWNDKKDQWLYGQIAAVCRAENIPVTESELEALHKAIKKMIGKRASLTEYGTTILSSETDSTAEDKAATPKAIKVLKDLISAVTRSLANYVAKSGDTMTGNLTLDNATSLIKGQQNGQDDWFVGRVRSGDNEIALASYKTGTSIHLKNNRIDLNSPIYRSNHLVFDEGNLTPVRSVDLRSSIPNATVTYQNATPAQLPMGGYVGITTNSQLAGVGTYTGIGQFVKAVGGESYRFGANNGRFFSQTGNSDGWGRVCEHMMVRPELLEEDLNNVTDYGIYAQKLDERARPERNYPEAQAGVLLVSPSAYGVQQEYTTHYSYNKYVRNHHNHGWGAWRRIDAQNSVKKSGDTMTGGLTTPWLKVQNGHGWANITSLTHGASWLDFTVYGSEHAQCSIECVDVGNYSTELRFCTTPRGANYLTSRRHHAATISPDGGVWTKEYGWLHDAFARYAKHSFYPSHYNGAEVWKIPIGNGNCLMITTINVSPTGSHSELHLPEHYTGWASPTATDIGAGRHRLGISMIGGSKVKVYSEGNTTMHIHVIGFGQF